MYVVIINTCLKFWQVIILDLLEADFSILDRICKVLHLLALLDFIFVNLIMGWMVTGFWKSFYDCLVGWNVSCEGRISDLLILLPGLPPVSSSQDVVSPGILSLGLLVWVKSSGGLGAMHLSWLGMPAVILGARYRTKWSAQCLPPQRGIGGTKHCPLSSSKIFWSLMDRSLWWPWSWCRLWSPVLNL